MRRSAWLAVAVLACSHSACDRGPEDESAVETTLEFEVATPPDAAPSVEGSTNLPAGTQLIVALDEARPVGLILEAECTVGDDGTFRSGPLGSDGPVPPGEYVVNVIMPISIRQPPEVQQEIGRRGEKLSGPLVREGPVGASVHKDRRLAVGGDDAVAQQMGRAGHEADLFEALQQEIESRFAELDNVVTQLREGQRLSDSTLWQNFTTPFSEQLEKLDAKLTEMEASARPPRLRAAFVELTEMHASVSQGDASGYYQIRSRFLHSIAGVKESIARLRAFAENGR